jgi:hypothetical protein
MVLWKSRALFERLIAESERSRESHQDLREFIREMNQRGEKHTNAVTARLDDQTTTLVAVQGEIAALQGEIEDQRKQIQANTQAVLSVLDRRS